MKITYEKQDCSRCGGSGKMPFSVRGGICFKCEGRGVTMTPAGRRAYTKVQQIQKQVCAVAASSLKPGDRVMHGGKVRTVADVKVRLGKGYGSGKQGVPGSDSYMAYSMYGETTLTFKNGSGFRSPAHHEVMKAWDTETLSVAAEAVKNYKGAEVVA